MNSSRSSLARGRGLAGGFAWSAAAAGALLLALGGLAASAGAQTSHQLRSGATTQSRSHGRGAGSRLTGARGAERQAGRRRASATLEECLTATAQSGRSATFVAEMATVPGTVEMAMKVDILDRQPGDKVFYRLRAPGMGVWRLSEPGVQIFKDVKQVTGLSAPGIYRALVHFRWIDSEGRILRAARRRTASCRQPASSEPAFDSEAPPARMPGR